VRRATSRKSGAPSHIAQEKKIFEENMNLATTDGWNSARWLTTLHAALSTSYGSGESRSFEGAMPEVKTQ
jgi:hypothetical protein